MLATAEGAGRARAVLVFAVRLAAKVGLGVILVLLVALLVLRVAARTDRVTARLLALALPRIQTVIAGRLTVGSIEGDLLGTFVIHDAAISAADGRTAIAARRLQGRIARGPLLHGEVRLVELRGEGVWFGMHMMPDGRFNLAGLAAPTAGPDPPPFVGPHPIVFAIEDAHLDGVLHYDAPTMPLSLRALDMAAHVEAGLEIASGLIRIPLAHIDGALLLPLSAPARAKGVLVIADGTLTLEGVGATLALDEAALHRLLPDSLLGGLAPLIDRLGPAELTLGLDGGVTPVAIRAQGVFPGTGATVTGVVTLDGEGPRWTASALARRSQLSSTGRLSWDWLGDYQGTIDTPDLAGLAIYGGPAVVGAVQASAQVRRLAGGSELVLDAVGASLRYGAVHVKHLVAHAATGLDTGTAHLTARGAELGPVHLAALAVDARDDGRALTLVASGHGPPATRFDLTVRGAPILGADRRAADAFAHATLEGQVAIEGQAWRTLTPARFELGDGLRVDGLALASGAARITGAGSYRISRGAHGAIAARVVVDHLDPGPLLALFAPGVAWPALELRAELGARGTASAPVLLVDASAHTPPGDARLPGGSATLKARYRAARVSGELSATLPGQRLRAWFASPFPPWGGGLLSGRAVVDADLAQLPAAALALGLPVKSGQIGASIEVGGTWRAPRISVAADGRQLAGAVLGRPIDRVDATVSGVIDPAGARGEASLAVRGMPLATLGGRATFAGGGLAASLRGWRQAVVAINGELPGYPLELLPELASRLGGLLQGTLALTGPLGRPSGTAALRVDDLQVGSVAFHGVTAGARLDSEGASVSLEAAAHTGALGARGRVPWSATAPWQIDLRATALPLDLAGLPLSTVRSVAGTLDAELRIDGTRARPGVSGFARAREVALTLGDGAIVYDHGELDVSASAGQVTLRTLSFRSATGTLEVHGAGRVDGLRPVALDGEATLVKLPLAAKGVSGWLTAGLDLHLQSNPSGYGGEVTVRGGLLTLADLSRVRSVQSTAPAAGVRYVDAAGLRAEAAARAAEALTVDKVAQAERAAAVPGATPDATLAVHLVNPFRVEGKELQASLQGQLEIDRLASRARVTGGISSTAGWVELLGRRYQIDRVKVDFDGAPVPDPRLDVRITRATDVTVVIEVQGRASSPELIFSSIPPVYSQEQIMAMILSGSPSSGDLGPESQATRVAGALSGTFAGQLKEQLLPVLPVDVIKVDLAHQSTGEEDTRFEVGKYLGESFYLSYVHQLGTVFGLRRLNRNQLQLDYRFARQFQIGASFGDEGVGALDLSWVHRY